MGLVRNQEIPQKIKDMLYAKFDTGKGNSPIFRGHFCADCGGESLLKKEVQQHKARGHRVLQAFCCSWVYGYNVNDLNRIPDLLDITGICRFKINKGFVLFPVSRKKRDRKNGLVNCVVCRAALSKLANPHRDLFCSILCKLESGSGLVRTHDTVMTDLNNQACFPEKNNVQKDCQVIQEGCQKKSVSPPRIKIKCSRPAGSTVSDKPDVSKQERLCTKEVSTGVKDVKMKLKRKRRSEGRRKEIRRQQEKKRKLLEDEERLKNLVETALDDEKVTVDSNSFRKRSRKGIPCRAPLY